jgi:spore germination protein
MLIHVVNAGETLWKISASYKVSVTSIIEANGLPNPNQLVIGQALLIPAGGLTHSVTSGESLWSIAKNYGVSVQDLIKANNISSTGVIYPGQLLTIPRKTKTIDVNGYIYILGNPAAAIIRETGRHLTYMSPFAYRIKEDGGLQAIDDSPAISAAYAERAAPMMSITNLPPLICGKTWHTLY